MSQQAELVFGPHPSPEEILFWTFHRANPHVYERLVRLARAAQSRGVKVGMRLLWERLRWHFVVVKREAGAEFAMNDHWPPYYARLISAQEPDLAEMFHVRGNKARLALLPTVVSR